METIGSIFKSIYSVFVSSGYNLDTTRTKTNYECEVCLSTGRPPNMLGRFIRINDNQDQCNGCGTVYQIVTPVQTNSIPVAQCVMIRD
jgi:hypothetical protein